MGKLKKFMARLHQDESGAMSVEKILILALISVPILILLYVFKTWIVGEFTTQQDKLENGANGG